MMKTTLKTLLAAACITMAATGVAIADQDGNGERSGHCTKGGHHNRHHAGAHGFGQPHFLHGITLTSEQEDKIFALNHAEVPKVRDQIKQRQQLHQELRQVSQAPQFDEAKAKAIADKLATLEKDGALNRARTENKVLAVLTPEQREQALKNKEQFKKHREDRQPAGFRGHPQQHPDVRS
ncbi:Spy/CpxP family protein refolding chaperone [Methylotenera sp. N17]|jgi:Spy/CpxP family protein refolding chaperone|uniref:Spy/CpxP family protein refolding chaperone n=1 Tax=Methylotenera sp. N17 TaxID=1502761 RepID=UPI00068968DB|nr:Spy/CpxP family protein refolding chaperone [Methylotenera sp. N17]